MQGRYTRPVPELWVSLCSKAEVLLMVNSLSYREVARFCGGLFAILSLVLIVFPQIVFVLLELSAANSAEVIAGRAGVLFAGLAVLMLSTATHRPSITLTRIADATAFLLMALAALGVIE